MTSEPQAMHATQMRHWTLAATYSTCNRNQIGKKQAKTDACQSDKALGTACLFRTRGLQHMEEESEE